jgi:hypothetical protein
MLSSVLHSARAILVNIAIMRAFAQLRQGLAGHAKLAGKLAELEKRIEAHDTAIRSLFDAVAISWRRLNPRPGARLVTMCATNQFRRPRRELATTQPTLNSELSTNSNINRSSPA